MFYLFNTKTQEPFYYFGQHGKYSPVYQNVESAVSYLKLLKNEDLSIRQIKL